VSAHSPGPWREGPTSGIGQVGRLRIVDANGVQVADCESPKRDSNSLVFVRPFREDTANAQLIAAAPELLDACRRLLKFNEELCADVNVSTHYPSADFARAAISKAKGRP
jgi:hypothetical protein